MKVLHAAEVIRGGVATVIRHNINHQILHFGLRDVAVLVPADQCDDLEQAPRSGDYTFRRTGRNAPSLLRFMGAFIQAMRRHRPDIVHLHSTWAGFFGRILLMLVPRALRPKIVYCPHGWAFLMDGVPAVKHLYAWLERRLARVTDAVICVSRHELDLAVSHGLPEDKLTLIYNGTPVPEHADADAMSTSASPEDRLLELLFVGRDARQKGLDVLIAAMAQLRSDRVHLTVLGATGYEAQGNVSCVGWVAGSEVLRYYRQADVLVMPSRWEGFSVVAVEAAMHGLPIVASDCCSLSEIVDDRVTGRLFPVGDVPALVRVLRETPRDDWRAMGERAAARARGLFSTQTMTAATTRLYEGLASPDNGIPCP